MKKTLLFLTIIGLIASYSFDANGQYTGSYDNVAAFKPATAIDSILGFGPSKAVDTLLTTWTSLQGDAPVWLEVDLGSFHSVDGFGLVFPNAGELATSLVFQTSRNGAHWTDRKNVSPSGPGDYEYYLGGILIVQYARVLISAKDALASISEFRVYGEEILPPTAPKALPATDVTGSDFTANWTDRVVATGYIINVSTESNFSSYVPGYQDLDVGDTLSSSVTGLSPLTDYYYRVSAYNITGTSNVSNTINVTTTKLSQTITFDALEDKMYGDADFALEGSTTSNLPNTYTSSDETVATINGDIVTVIGIGESDITASQEGDSQYDPAVPVVQNLVVTKRTLSVDGTVAENKAYDGTALALISGAVLVGVVDTEDVVLENTDSATFIQADIGTEIEVVTSMTLSGADTANYMLEQPDSIVADITAKELIVSGSSVENKVYDATTDAAITGATLEGVVGSEDVSLTDATSGTFAQADVSEGVEVTISMALTGADTANYSLVQPSGLSANITTKELTITADDKSREECATNPEFTITYDGFAGTEDESVLDPLATVSCDADESSPDGTYDIVAAGAGSANYELIYVNGTLTITPDLTQPELLVKDITVTLDASGQASITPSDVVVSASDNCAVTDTTLSQSTFTSDDLGDVTILVTATDASGNATIETAVVTVEKSTGFRELNEISFKSYPNPTEGKVHLEFNSHPDELTVMDVTGKTIIQTSIVDINDVIDLSEYNAGIYMFRVKFGEELVHFKVVKK